MGFLVVIFLIGSVGIVNPFFYICFLIFVVLGAFGWQAYKESVMRTPKAGWVVLGFLLSSLGSLYYSIDYEKSTSVFLLYFLCFGVYLCTYNYKDRLEPLVGKFLIITSVVLCLGSTLVYFFSDTGYRTLDGYQLIFSRFGSHNHLGDYLALTIIFCLFSYLQSKRNSFLLLVLFFIPFFIFSYSRSAYLSLMVGCIYLILTKVKLSVVRGLIFSGVLLIILVLFLSITYESRSLVILRPVNEFLVSNFDLKYKTLLGQRDSYFYVAYLSFREKPWFGVGPGNYVYASEKYSTKPKYKTDSSHNIFLDILVENGIVPSVVFIVFIVFIFKESNTKTLSFILLLSLLVNFQTDYTHRINSLIILFYVIAGISSGSRGIKESSG